jgi:CubicO group peptidase (beta-lactamase class C family)
MKPLSLVLIPLILQAPSDAQTLGKGEIDTVDGLVSAYMSRHGVPGLTVAVALDGRVTWSKGYGMADVENSVRATSETVYRSASIGKPITATAAMRLVEQHKLDLDKPIQDYCAAFPKKPWPITARHLLAHTSGIRHYGGPHDREEQTSTVHYDTVVKALTPFKDDPLLFEPGTKYSYSTYGYDVLGCVIEGAAGEPFMDVIRSCVFKPSGMMRSRDDDPAAIIPHRAGGYVRINGQLRVAPHVDMSNRLPAGGYATTAVDLAAFAANFMDDKLVSRATRDLMLTELSLKGETVNYGLGWGIEEDKSGRPTGAAFHGGSSPGLSGMLYIVPKKRLAIAMLANLESAPERNVLVAAIAKEIMTKGSSSDKRE